MKDAEVVITNTYRTQMVEHAYLEPEAGVASYEEGKLTIWIPSKYAHADRREIAGVLGLPLDQVRVINATIGGTSEIRPLYPRVTMPRWRVSRQRDLLKWFTRERNRSLHPESAIPSLFTTQQEPQRTDASSR